MSLNIGQKLLEGRYRVMNHLFCLFFFLISNSVCVGQQTIRGKILDKVTKDYIVGAKIETTNGNEITISDVNGEFLIKNSQSKIQVSSVGYRTKIILPSENYIVIELEQESIGIDEVVLTVKTEARQLMESTMPVTIINTKDIQGAVTDTKEILAKTAGVTIRSTGGVGSSSRISIRGLEGKRIGFFINSRSMSDNTDFLDINDIPIDLIERIEVYKGIVPGRLGGSAMGGAVNIITKEYPDKNIDLSYSLSSYNTHRASAIAKFNNEDKTYNYGFGGFYTSSDNDYKMGLPLQKGKYVTRQNDGYKKLLFGGGFSTKKWYFDEIEIKPLYVQSRKEIQGIENRISEAYSYTDMFALSLSAMEKENFLTDGLDLNFSSIYSYSMFGLVDNAMQRQNWDDSFYPANSEYGGEIGKNPNDAQNKKYTFLNRLNLEYFLSELNSINLNVTYNHALGKPKDELKDKVLGYQTNFNTLLNSATANFTYTHRNKNDIWLNATTLKGYSYDVTSKILDPNGVTKIPTDVKLSKRDFGVNHSARFRASPKLMFKFSGAYDLRIPSEEELIGDGFMIRPSGNLEPERNLGFNVGGYFDKENSDERRLQLEANIFYSYLKNMIRFTGNFLNAKYENFGRMRTYGLDADVKYDASKSIYLFGNATLQDLRDVQKFNPGSTVKSSTYGLRMPNIPYLYANFGGEFHRENLFGGQEQKSRLFVTSSFVNKYFYDFEVSRFQDREIPTSLTFDLGAEHSWRNGNSSVGLQFNNLTNQTIMTEFRRPLPGRMLSIKLRHIINE